MSHERQQTLLAQSGKTVVSRCFVGCLGKLVNAVATAAAVVYVIMQATFDRPSSRCRVPKSDPSSHS